MEAYLSILADRAAHSRLGPRWVDYFTNGPVVAKPSPFGLREARRGRVASRRSFQKRAAM
jgi:hypothetical protein